MTVVDHRHHHNVPPDVFEEIPAEPYWLQTGWAKRIEVRPVFGSAQADELHLVFFRVHEEDAR